MTTWTRWLSTTLAIAGCAGCGAAETPTVTPRAARAEAPREPAVTPPPALHGAPQPTPASQQAAVAEAATAEAPTIGTTRELPSSCADKATCEPPRSFVEAVCKRKFPDLPLFLFAGRMPWQHRYVKAEFVEPVNPHGGEQSEAWMKFGEEVVILRHQTHGSKGMQVSGPSDVDVLRWDGTCATIREEMLVSYVPAPMQSPRIIWKYLTSELQEALLKNPLVARAREAEKKGCRDSSATHPTPTCEKAMQKLTDAIVLAIHQNHELPTAGKLPEWVK